MKFRTVSLIIGALTAFVTVKAQAAERISFNFFPLGEFYLQVDDLDAFVTTGEMSSELAYYLDRLPEKTGSSITPTGCLPPWNLILLPLPNLAILPWEKR